MPTDVAIINEVVQLHREIQDALSGTVAKAIKIGTILLDRKETLRHGDFGPWIKANCPFGERAAYNYIKVAQYKDILQIGTGCANLQEAYKQVETLEAQERKTDGQKARERVTAFVKTGQKPEGWRRGTDDKLADEQRERDKQFNEYQAKWKLKNEERMREAEEKSKSSSFDYDEISKITNAMVANINKRQSFKESIRVSHEGKDDPFVDAIMDYLETLADDSRRIEACYNIIKVCKGIANQLQAVIPS